MSQKLIHWLNDPLPLKPLYYVVGEESYFISEIRKTLMKNVHKNSGMADFNQDDLDARQVNLVDLISALETLPIMSDKRLVFCQNADSFKEEDWEKLKSFIEKPLPSVIFVCFFQKIDRRKKIFKKLKMQATELLADTLREWELAPWVQYIAKDFGLKFPSASQSLFCQLVGTNLMEISSEMNKLKTYMGDRDQVTEEDLLAVVSKTKIRSVFDLTDAIGRKDLVNSLNYLACLLENDQNEIGALALVARHMRILARFQEGEKRSLPKSKILALTGVAPYFFKNYLEQSQLWSESQMIKVMEILFETDKALKSSPLSSRIWLENFILKACS